MSKLFTPLKLRELTLENRIAVAPMSQYSGSNGEARDWHLIHLGQLVLSGAGLVIQESTAVSPEGRTSLADLGLWSDETEAAMARILSRTRVYTETPVFVQLNHGGRKSSVRTLWRGGSQLDTEEGGWQTVAPSAIPFHSNDRVPQALIREDMNRVRQCFSAAAERAARAGYDGIELQMGHGFLLHQFLSPVSNQRTDEYGGILGNRLRYPLEVFEQIRDTFPASKPVGVRISATDWIADGWNIEQALVLAEELHRRGCDYFHVSSGGLAPQQAIQPTPGYQASLAERIKHATGLPTIAVGLITEPAQAENIIASGQADMVALGRAMLWNPRWVWGAATELKAQVTAPRQYFRAAPPGAEVFKFRPE